MSRFRYSLGRMVGGLLALGMFALFLNALILSQQQFMASDAARSGPPPALVALKDARFGGSGTEVNALARIDASVDVALPGGTGRLFLLADPESAKGSAARVAVFISPVDFPAFEALLAATTQGTGEAPVFALNGAVTTPYWIDRAEAAAADSKLPLATDVQFVRPFLHGRDAGLAPPLLAWLVPAVLFVLLAGLVWSEIRSMTARRRARIALHGLDSLDREVEAMAAFSATLQPGDRQWAEISARRHMLRKKRAGFDAVLSRSGKTTGSQRVWQCIVAGAGFIGILPRRPLLDALSTHLVGADLRETMTLPLPAGWLASANGLMALPGEMLASAVLAVMGPQSIGVAFGIRAMPFTIWVALSMVLMLLVVRRNDIRRSERGSFR